MMEYKSYVSLPALIVDNVHIVEFVNGYFGKVLFEKILENQVITDVFIFEFSGNGARAIGYIGNILIISELIEYTGEFIKTADGKKYDNLRVTIDDLKHAEWRNAWAWMPITDEVIDRSYRNMTEDEYFEKYFPENSENEGDKEDDEGM